MTIRRTVVRAPASVGNVGPGFDVLGLAIEGIGITVTLTPDESGPRVGNIRGLDADLIPTDNERNSVIAAALVVFGRAGVTPAFRVDIENELPFSGGLGGSATAAVAGAGAALASLGRDIDVITVMECALEAEEKHSGLHLDNIASAALGGLTFTLDAATVDAGRVPVAEDWYVALVTPRARVVTREARSILADSSPRSLWVKQMAKSVALVHAFVVGDADLVRRALDDEFAERARSSLVPGFAAIKTAALESGALGSSISGSGPTIFAIAEDEVTATTVMQAMAEAAGGNPPLARVCAIAEQGVHELDDL